MGGELSKEYIERTKIMSYNNFFAWLGSAAMFKLNTIVFFAFGPSHTCAGAYGVSW